MTIHSKSVDLVSNLKQIPKTIFTSHHFHFKLQAHCPPSPTKTDSHSSYFSSHLQELPSIMTPTSRLSYLSLLFVMLPPLPLLLLFGEPTAASIVDIDNLTVAAAVVRVRDISIATVVIVVDAAAAAVIVRVCDTSVTVVVVSDRAVALLLLLVL